MNASWTNTDESDINVSREPHNIMEQLSVEELQKRRDSKVEGVKKRYVI